MELMPVRMKLLGYSRETGFMAAPFVAALRGVDLAQAVYGPARAVKHAAEYLVREGDGHRLAEEARAGALHIYAAGALEDLDDDAVALYEDDPAAAAAAVGEEYLRQLVVGGALHALERDQGALYFG